MFCPECGSKLKDDATFCSGCGKKVSAAESVENASTSNSESPAVNGLEKNDGQRKLKDEVKFAPNLKEPVVDIPEAKPTGSELGNELTKFANIYEVSVENYLDLLEIMQAKESLKKHGYQWYYDHAKDPVIEASRQINAEIKDAENLLGATRAQIAQNEQSRLQAAQRRDGEKISNQNSAQRTKKWTGRKRGCLAAIVGYFIVGSLGAVYIGNASGNSGTMIAGILLIALLAVGFIWYTKNGKNKVQNAQKLANARSYNADLRFDEIAKQLAAKDADLSAQCTQIENRITELRPIAGEIRHQANERAQFLYSVEMLEINELMQRVAEAAISQTQTLREMGTIPDEEEWFESRHIAKIVVSGRADTLKEALNLLDTANYRDADLKIKGEMLEAQQMTQEILAIGFTEMIETQQQTIATIRDGFSDVTETMEIHHAQNMAMQAKQIRQNATIIDNLAKGNSIMDAGFQNLGQDVASVGQSVQEGNEANKKWQNEASDYMAYNTAVNAARARGDVQFDSDGNVWDSAKQGYVKRPD